MRPPSKTTGGKDEPSLKCLHNYIFSEWITLMKI